MTAVNELWQDALTHPFRAVSPVQPSPFCRNHCCHPAYIHFAPTGDKKVLIWPPPPLAPGSNREDWLMTSPQPLLHSPCTTGKFLRHGRYRGSFTPGGNVVTMDALAAGACAASPSRATDRYRRPLPVATCWTAGRCGGSLAAPKGHAPYLDGLSVCTRAPSCVCCWNGGGHIQWAASSSFTPPFGKLSTRHPWARTCHD